MSDLSGTSLAGLCVAVVGAGAVGLSLAVRLARSGARTILYDPADSREEASGVAAGMLAPVGEALFDDPRHLPLWRAAAKAWPAFAETIPGLRIEPCGARFPGAALSLQPEGMAGLDVFADGDALVTGEDARLDPWPALAALEAAFHAAGGERRREPWTMRTDAEATVIAAGYAARALSPFAAELSVLTPIKGQLLRFEGGPAHGPILRAAEGYLVPSAKGAVVGATMEPGREDRDPTDAARRRLLAAADALQPGLSRTPHRLLAGVRAATPDGLPLVGPSSREGVLIAAGLRRNGWLLAPLVSEMILAYLSGGEVGPHAAALDPRRFARP